MAAADLILESIQKVESRSFEMSCLLEAFDELGGDHNVPSWLVIVYREVRAMQAEVDALGIIVRRDAVPYLRDLDAAAKGGMGAVAPMVTTVMAGQSAPSRT